MDDSIFARLGYDPVRIHTFFHGRPPAPGGIARLGSPAPPEEEPEGGGSEPILPELASGRGTARSAVEGDGDPAAPLDPSDGAEDPSTPTPAASRSPSPSELGEDPDDATSDTVPVMRAWINEHWDTVQAMARAGEAPVRPAPPPPEPPPPAPLDPADRPRPHVARGDRWTKWKMAEFLRQLAATHSVSAAARAVGMSRNSAYKLRARLKGEPFDIAWEAAFRHGYDDLAQAALELALEGEEVPHYYRGELKGTHRKRNPQMIMGLLRLRNRAGAPMLGRYNAAAEFWSEHWDQLVHRIETGSVTWDDERLALGEAELAKLELPDAKQHVDRITVRNLPDEPRGPGRKA